MIDSSPKKSPQLPDLLIVLNQRGRPFPQKEERVTGSACRVRDAPASRSSTSNHEASCSNSAGSSPANSDRAPRSSGEGLIVHPQDHEWPPRTQVMLAPVGTEGGEHRVNWKPAARWVRAPRCCGNQGPLGPQAPRNPPVVWESLVDPYRPRLAVGRTGVQVWSNLGRALRSRWRDLLGEGHARAWFSCARAETAPWSSRGRRTPGGPRPARRSPTPSW